MNNEEYMKRCYELAIRAGKKGFDTFGAVLVHNGEILEEAENTADWETQPTGKKASSAMRNSTWFTNARAGIRIPS